MNSTLETIHKRRSVRSYQPEAIREEELQTILDAGASAPSAMNRQSYYFIALRNPSLRAQLSELALKLTGRDSDPFYGAPTVVLMFGEGGTHLSVCDCSLAMGNMMLAAQSIGVASCWINCVIDLLAKPEAADFLAAIGAPEGYTCICSCALGYLKGEAPKARPRREGIVKIC